MNLRKHNFRIPGRPWARRRVLARLVAAALVIGAARPAAAAEWDNARIERLIAAGQPEEAMTLLKRELERAPEQPRLWHDYGVAAYAAGQFHEALLAFDKAEGSRRPDLMTRSQRQKGNAEFHLGWQAQAANVDETIHRWQRSLGHYRTVMRRTPDDELARTNHDIVRKLLLKLLLERARAEQARARQEGLAPEARVDSLRGAHEAFGTAVETDETNAEARQGEQETRAELARTLATEGRRNAAADPALAEPQQMERLQQGVRQLDDAHTLLPEDRPIEQQWDQARTTLADRLTLQARQEIDQARRTNAEPARVSHLGRAIRRANAALEQQENHELARAALSEAREELAALHEKRADESVRRAEPLPPEPQAQQLDAALREYENALELRPDSALLRGKAARTEKRLEEVLRQVAAALVPDPSQRAGKPTESLEQKAARLEGAQHALHDLAHIKADPETTRRLAEVEKQLARVRDLAAGLQPSVEIPTSAPVSLDTAAVGLAPVQRRPPPPAAGSFKSEAMVQPTRDY